MPPQRTDFIVVGAGVAGLRAAISLAAAGRVLVITKQEITESATQYAQGGIAVALSDEDEIGLHLQDTIDAGDGLVNADAARVLVEEGPERIQELIDWGTEFDRSGSRLTFTREAAHSRSRILHAHGDSTGREIGRALAAKARSLPNITFSEFEFSKDLALRDGRVCGVELIGPHGPQVVSARAVLLATGGAGQVFRDTTNPTVATADGVAMAWRAGAVLSDMEFVQFHPTALAVEGAPRFLLSEALRGEGAVLLNSRFEPFMLNYDPRAELASRDIVARSIVRELLADTSPHPTVYLDMRPLGEAHVKQRFPRIYSTCLKYGVDITANPVPIRPAAHYLMGGVRTDLLCRTSLPGLYAAGETACTGVHGANRLASNSLLEGLVFGARAGEAMRLEAGIECHDLRSARIHHTAGDPESVIHAIQELMWRCAGVLREISGLSEALTRLDHFGAQLPDACERRACEARNIHAAATLIARSALAREESRGAHFRTDFPAHNDARFRKQSLVRDGEAVTFE